jgi:hypothetical protein
VLALDAFEEANLAEIESLNQRGGRTLSLADLISDGTLSVEMGAYLLVKMASGACVLTAAQASGTGKSTLLANLLGFLPAGERIISTSDVGVIASGLSARNSACYLAHEIGAGRWYGYIWGRAVGDYFKLSTRGHRLAAAIHADSMDELEISLTGAPLNIPGEALKAMNLIVFMGMQRTTAGILRRVTMIYELADSEYGPAYAWDAKRDAFMPQELALPSSVLEGEKLASATELVTQLVREQIRDFRAMRSAVLDWYGRQE